jgi:hypothetical protein
LIRSQRKPLLQRLREEVICDRTIEEADGGIRAEETGTAERDKCLMALMWELLFQYSYRLRMVH